MLLPEGRTQRLVAFAVLAVMPVVFSSNLVLGRAALGEVEPWTLAFGRWGLAFLIMLPIAGRDGIARLAELRREAWSLLILGFLGMVICGGLVYVALVETTATNGILIYATSPVMIVLLELALYGRVVAPREAIGIVLAFAGIVAIVAKADLSALLHLDFNGGDILFAIAAFAWAIYSVMLRRPGLKALPTATLFMAIAGAGALLLAPFALAEAVLAPAPLTARGAVLMLVTAIVPSVIAFSAYQHGVKTLGPSVTGFFLYLLPIAGVGMAVAFLGETLHPYHLIGSALVIGGVIIATVRLTPRRA